MQLTTIQEQNYTIFSLLIACASVNRYLSLIVYGLGLIINGLSPVIISVYFGKQNADSNDMQEGEII